MPEFLKFLYEHYLDLWQSARIRDVVQIFKRTVSLPKVPENMARYQSSLDNELYKAMRALREA